MSRFHYFTADDIMCTIDYLLNNSALMLILGLFIGLVMSYKIARWTVRFNEEAKAGRKLCGSFDEFLAWWDVKNTKYAPDDWYEFMRLQKAAIREYVRFIKPRDRDAFDRACKNYFNQKTKEEHIYHYQSSSKELYEKIEAILKFVKH